MFQNWRHPEKTSKAEEDQPLIDPQ